MPIIAYPNTPLFLGTTTVDNSVSSSLADLLVSSLEKRKEKSPSTKKENKSSSRALSTTISDQDFFVSIDLPGVRVGDLKLHVEDHTLFVSGFRRMLSSDGDASKRNRFSYTASMDEDVDISKIKANLSDGVLVIVAPKKPKPAAVVIPISNEPLEEFSQKYLRRSAPSSKVIEDDGHDGYSPQPAKQKDNAGDKSSE